MTNHPNRSKTKIVPQTLTPGYWRLPDGGDPVLLSTRIPAASDVAQLSKANPGSTYIQRFPGGADQFAMFRDGRKVDAISSH